MRFLYLSISLEYSGRKLQHSRPGWEGVGLNFSLRLGSCKDKHTHTPTLFLNTGDWSNSAFSKDCSIR